MLRQSKTPVVPARVELLTIGREILDGRVIDTNSVFMAESLKQIGLVPRYAQRVDDDRERIQEAFTLAATRADIILVTGGLGPTSDDITAECLATFLGERLALNAEALAQVQARLTLLKRPLTEVQQKQALLPPSCFVLPNPEGTAPGFGVERASPWGSSHAQQWFFMPGVPREMKRMLREHVLPRLPGVAGYRTWTWATHFTAEADLQVSLTPLEKQLPPGFEVTYRTRFPENHVGLHADCDTPERSQAFDDFKQKITTALDETCFSSGALSFPSLEQIVLQKLQDHQAALFTVESCTGGLIAHRITELSGSSRALIGGEVVYDNEVKIALGVPRSTILQHGAVSRETAIALAQSGLERLQRLTATQKFRELYCIATTGIAGPTGGTPEKPVGLCHIALARSTGPTLHEEVHGRSALDRSLLKLFFAQKALDLLRKNLLA
ncbi:MAG: nicotinamide-nucleotide amidohydrolase family protein [Bdellovibrionales bacterium]|nr:nicotinamide-nucleotide amidohydrolase family protein [Bdellovibrionales bacterium]